MRFDQWKRARAVASHSARGALQEPVMLLANTAGVMFFVLLLRGSGLTLPLLFAASFFSTLRWRRVMHDPVMLIFLGGGMTRRGFLVGEFAGSLAASFLTASVQVCGCAVLLCLKGAEFHPAEFAGGVLMLAWWFAVIHAWGMMVAIYVDQLIGRLIAMAFFCLVIGVAPGGIDIASRPILEMAALLVPLLFLLAGDARFRGRDLQVDE